MMANLPVLQSRHVREFTDLEAIPSGEHNFAASRFQFRNDGNKERDVRGIFQVDPDFLPGPRSFLRTDTG